METSLARGATSLRLVAESPQERVLILEPGRAEKNYWR